VTVDVSVDALLLQYEIEQFLYHEALLLDQRKLHDWLDLFTEDTYYWMPIRSTRAAGDEEGELTNEHEHAYFADDKDMLRMRIAKLDTGYSWSEDPPSRTRHVVSNVRIVERPSSEEYLVESYFVTYRSRLATDEDLWVGLRQDTLRKVGGEWKIARRKIILDQTVLKSKNLSSFL